MNEVMAKLKAQIRGELYSDIFTRHMYSVDASIYQVEPVAVVVAKEAEDIEAAVQTAVRAGLSVTVRGAATGINGACIGEGLIIDTSKYLTKIHEINVEAAYAICDPGVIQDQLNQAVARHGLCLGPDTSTGNRATLGGMLGNNAAGAHSMRYGKMVDHVIAAQILLADGSMMVCGEESEASFHAKCQRQDAIGRIFRVIRDRIRAQAEAIDAAFPKIQRRVSGYNLDEMIKPFPINIAKLIVGSEGTLGIATRLKVKLSPKPACSVLSVLHFHKFRQGLEAIGSILEFKPFSLELMDKNIMDLGRRSPSMQGQLDWLQGDPEVLMCAEFDGATPGEALHKQKLFDTAFNKTGQAYANLGMADKASQAKVWKVRKAGLGLLLSARSDTRAVAFLEDVAVAPEKMPDFLQDFDELMKAAGKDAGFYGHAGVGCLHIRPMLNLKLEKEVDVMVKMMEDAADMLKKYGGALSGEHGDGLTRSWLNERMFGTAVYGLFKEVKTAFDPEAKMNPGKIVNAPGPKVNLKARKSIPKFTPKTFYDFSAQGGINFAVDMCNGNGACRSPRDGLMCPSFQATGDERLSTRARAQSLHAILNGQVADRHFSGKELHDVLDLCLECKGCKTQCPSQVDMAKLKSEFLHHYRQKHGLSLRTHLFSKIDLINQVGSLVPHAANFMMRGPAKLLTAALGIAPQRSLPPLAPQRFSQALKKRTAAPRPADAPKVVLFNDTFNEYNTPEIGLAALQVLEACGFEVIVPRRSCCGRPLVSKGLLPEARAAALALIAILIPYARQQLPIIGLEPSCIFTLIDEYPELIEAGPAREEALLVAQQCQSFPDFLARHLRPELLQDPAGLPPVRLHEHCHQKALRGSAGSLKVLKMAAGTQAAEIDSGCCGMAGTFGYEKEHYALSLKIGESRLFPALRAAPDATLVANGMSCRCQIKDGVQRPSQHLAQFIASRLKKGTPS